MEFKPQIEQLQGANNWSRWRRQVELLLQHQEVLDIVKGNKGPPEVPDVKEPDAVKSKYEHDYKIFNKGEALAQLILVSSMNDTNIDLTATCKSASEIWNKLLSVYEQSSGQRVDRLMEKLFTCEKDSVEDIATYIARLQRNFSELNEELKSLVKTELPDLLLMSRIMSTLPSEYFEFKSVWESIPLAERTVNKLTERLRLIEMRLPERRSDSSALTVNEKKEKKNADKSDKRPERKEQRKCFKCHKVGHLAKDCYKKYGNARNLKKAPKPEGEAFQTMKKGFLFSANQNGCIFKKDGTVKLRDKRTTKGLFVLDMQVCLPEIDAEVQIASSKENLQLWHERLCHQNKKYVQKVLKRKGIEIQSEEDFCDGCVLGKHQRKRIEIQSEEDFCDGIWIEAEGNVIRSRDVFFKKEMPLKEKLQLLFSKKQKDVDPTSHQTEKVAVNDEPLKEGENDIEVTTSEEAVVEDGIPTSSTANLEMDVKRQQRDTKKPAYLRDYVYLAEYDAPDSYELQ
ncbi:GAG-pre-integrase domain [Popillia japonica]|uniref:GAG-pre-integrase domain n=1 Tax=Popillia japonica TaxID=7064 RepID=A0AAW1LBD3_POPJA